MSAMWVVVGVGCLECEVPSDIIGSYATEAEAWAQVAVTNKGGGSQYVAMAFEVDLPAGVPT